MVFELRKRVIDGLLNYFLPNNLVDFFYKKGEKFFDFSKNSRV